MQSCVETVIFIKRYAIIDLKKNAEKPPFMNDFLSEQQPSNILNNK